MRGRSSKDPGDCWRSRIAGDPGLLEIPDCWRSSHPVLPTGNLSPIATLYLVLHGSTLPGNWNSNFQGDRAWLQAMSRSEFLRGS
eukprot:1352982-Amorphochlora_amoeboformis.AAC.1